MRRAAVTPKRPRQIMCYLDCYAHLIEQNGRFDWRPMYIGAWNADFDSDGRGIYYFSTRRDSVDWPERFQELYGGKAVRWLNHQAGKTANYAALSGLAKELGPGEAVLVMADLFWLPYSPQYRTKHIPHVLIIRGRTEEGWRIEDPYIGWNGCMSDPEMEAAFCYEDLAMGLKLDVSSLHAPRLPYMKRLLEDELESPPGPLVREVERLLTSAYEEAGSGEGGSKRLVACIENIRIISKRMKAYPLVIGYLAAEDAEEAEPGVTLAAELSKAWEVLLLHIARMSVLGSRMDFAPVARKLKDIEELEAGVKKELGRIYALWKIRFEETGCLP